MNLPLRKTALEKAERMEVFGYDHEPARVPVQSVNQARPIRIPDLQQLWKEIEECVNERASMMSGTRVDNHACGFVDDHNAVILEHDFQGNIFGNQGAWAWRRYLQVDLLPLAHSIASGLEDVVDGDIFPLNKRL